MNEDVASEITKVLLHALVDGFSDAAVMFGRAFLPMPLWAQLTFALLIATRLFTRIENPRSRVNTKRQRSDRRR
jgi:hypothetical protein